MKIAMTAALCAATVLAACTPVTVTAPASQPYTPAPTLARVDDGSLVQEETIVVEKPTERNQPMSPLMSQAITDLAERLGVAPEQIEVVSAEAVVWPDGSLGCPQPGMLYPQVLQEGMRIRLAVAGVIYQYHSGERRAPFLCTNPSEPAPPGVGFGKN